ncbi:MAG: acyl-CoA dehydrogenase [Streptosporangiales bacterium]|nr:acyl-CoA dehydrogenase [Streptosporangiales bacterium]
MELVLTGEQEELRATVRRFFEERSPISRVREIAEGDRDHDPDLWKRLSGELGLAGLIVPEEHGGAGSGHVELAVVLEEAGRALAPVPYLASAALAPAALLATGDEKAKAELLPGIAAGETIATVAGADSHVTVTASGAGEAWTLSGRADLVLDGAYADLLMVVAASEHGTGLFAVRADADGLTRRRLTSNDLTRSLARVDFAGTPARRLEGFDPDHGPVAIQAVADLALAAEQLGGLRRCLDMTLEYVRLRMQFGRPIGSFQAVKHACADMYSDADMAYAALRHAAWAADGDPDAFPQAAAVAKIFCSDVYERMTAQTIQLHGGIGFTWEHDAHLYFKRARGTAGLFGSTARHRARLADRLGV